MRRDWRERVIETVVRAARLETLSPPGRTNIIAMVLGLVVVCVLSLDHILTTVADDWFHRKVGGSTDLTWVLIVFFAGCIACVAMMYSNEREGAAREVESAQVRPGLPTLSASGSQRLPLSGRPSPGPLRGSLRHEDVTEQEQGTRSTAVSRVLISLRA